MAQVVSDEIETSEFARRLVDDSCGYRVVPEIGRNGERLAALFLDLFRDLVDGLFVAIDDCYSRALSGEDLRNGTAHARCGCCDNANFALKSHARFPFGVTFRVSARHQRG